MDKNEDMNVCQTCAFSPLPNRPTSPTFHVNSPFVVDNCLFSPTNLTGPAKKSHLISEVKGNCSSCSKKDQYVFIHLLFEGQTLNPEYAGGDIHPLKSLISHEICYESKLKDFTTQISSVDRTFII